MDQFRYRQGELFCEDVPVARIAEQAGTPVYVYSTAGFREQVQGLQKAFADVDALICFSVKSCGNINILRVLAEMGIGFDVVSGGELHRVLTAGGLAEKVVYSGVGKTDDEICQSLRAGIGYFNVESPAELENLIRLAGELDIKTQAGLRINPDVDPKTHRHTTTGKKGTKFGIDIEEAPAVFRQFGRDSRVKLTGIDMHIGSPVNSVEPYVQAITKALERIDTLAAEGFTIESLDIGGGFGTDYVDGQAPAFAEYAAGIVPLLAGRKLKIILEPGRSISGNAGVLLSRVLYKKQSGAKHFAIVDGAMTDLIRPALYDAFHFVWPVAPADGYVVSERTDPVDLPGLEKVDVVGPVCESADFLAKGRLLPPLQRGDLLAVFTAGAFSFVMSSQYNARPRAAEVLVDGDSFSVIRRRETYDDLIALEQTR